MLDRIEINRLESTPIEGVAERLGMRVERHKARCPWHDDSRPSLTFDTRKNRYRCYVCGEHGGVIDLVMRMRGCGFREAVVWLDGDNDKLKITNYKLKITNYKLRITNYKLRITNDKLRITNDGSGITNYGCVGTPTTGQHTVSPPDLEWLRTLVQPKVLNEEARRFLFDERGLDARVVAWCGLSSISWACPCRRYGRAFYDAPSLMIPYYDKDGRLMSVQSRYLGHEDKPRFKFPKGSNCHIYGMQILRYLRPGEELWITEGCSDCWAMLSAGKKAIAIPSATLLKDADIAPLCGLNLHMAPDQDLPGERLYMSLRERLPQLVRHQLPAGCKDFGEYYAKKVKS